MASDPGKVGCKPNAKPAVGDIMSALSPIPMKERLHLDRIGAFRWVLTDVVTRESKPLPEGDWGFEFDDDPEMAAVVRLSEPSDPQFLLVDEFMTTGAAKNDDGEIFLRDSSRDSKYYPLERLRTTHRVGCVQLRLGAANTAKPFDVFVLKWARACGQRVHWGLKHFYEALGMKSYDGEYSKWVWSSLKPWRKVLERHLPGNHFILSNHANAGCKKQEDLPYSDRMLDQPAISSVALLLLLSRWSRSKPQAGGLIEVACKAAAGEVLDAMLAEASRRCQGKLIEIVFDPVWACTWPRPCDGKGVLREEFQCCDGGVDFGRLLGLDGDLAANVTARQWSKAIFVAGDVGEGRGLLSFSALLDRVVPVRQLEAFTAQILFALASHLEMSLGESLKLGEKACLFSFAERPISAHSQDLDVRLFNYVSACVNHSLAWNVLGVATDKANPCSGGIVNIVFSYPDNKLAIACPQVSAAKPSKYRTA
jgi:hypothetical protein